MSGQQRNPLLTSSRSVKLETKSSLLSTRTTISKKPKSEEKEHVTDDRLQRSLQLTRQLSDKPISAPSGKLVGTTSRLSDKYAVSTSLNKHTIRKTSAQTTTRAKTETLLKPAKPVTLKTSNLQTKSLLLSATKSGLLTTTTPPLASALRSSPKPSYLSSDTNSGKYYTSSLRSSSAVTSFKASHVNTRPVGKTSRSLVKSRLEPTTRQNRGNREGATGRDDADSAAAPHYDLKLDSTRDDREDEVETFLPPELDPFIHEPAAPTINIAQVKHSLVNCVAASLLKQPDFQDTKNATRVMLCQLTTTVGRFDAEFVLKVALYTRCDLNIRTTANFLLALASNMHGCRPFLKKYYSAAIRLPSDWIEVAEIYTSFHDRTLNFGSLPTSLRKVMIDRFSSFDVYQLAKYNKDSRKSQKGKQVVKATKGAKQTETKDKEADKKIDDTDSDTDGASSVVSDDKSETDEELERMSFTLKQLVRKLHISEPAEAVMGLIGKKYPENREEFRRSKLQGVWDEERAGKRMKLPTPETWETQVSSKGNKASTWETLIDHKKLPFMAMLRNLRNLILAGVSEKHHKWVLKKLTDEGSVINSHQFPFRFFSAYEVLNELERAKKEGVGQMNRGQAKRKKLSKTAEEKYKKQIAALDVALLSRYRKALDTALKISTSYNVKPIAGSTMIICYLDKDTDAPCTSAKGLGKPRTILEVIILLALMCKYACEHSVLLLCGPQGEPVEMELEDGTILENMERILKQPLAKPTMVSADKNFPMDHLHQLIHTQTHIENLILLQGSQGSSSINAEKEMSKFLQNYRRFVNANLLYVDVDVSGSTEADPTSSNPSHHHNDVHLSGFSDNILRFIAERGGSGQMTYIENIDKAYVLKSVKSIGLAAAATDVLSLSPEKALLTAGQPKIWRTVRVFISSTFRDMHGERDLLTRFVFPELRARAHSRCIQIYEADLRWGVTEEDARSARALEICLGEISRSHYFIGMLGQRYGWVQGNYVVPDLEEYDWIREYPTHRSITELEMYHAALADPEKAMKKAFFFFRDKAFLSEVPEEHTGSFVSSSFEDECKIEALKSRIRESGLEVYDKYPARWFGIAEGKPMAGGLEDFGYRVLNVLWNRIQKDFPLDDPNRDAMVEANNLHMATMESFSETFVGRRELLQEAMAVLQSNKHRIIVGCGKSGSGKSAFMAALAQLYIESLTVKMTNLVIPHFIGAAPNSGNIAAILRRLCHEMKQRFSVKLDVPSDYANLVLEWPEFLTASAANIGSNTQMVILIDGLDLLENKHGALAMEWLPSEADIPSNVVVMLSCREGQAIHSVLTKRQPAPHQITIGALNIFDKAEMVRRSLSKHRKTLDESPFGNQMKLLLSKKEANNPLYLYLACEELRMFGVFEEVTTRIRSMSPTIGGLLQEILTRLEGEHGTELVTAAMSFIAIARDGLQEGELSTLVAMYQVAPQMESLISAGTKYKLPPATIARLFRSIQNYLQQSNQEKSDLLMFSHQDVQKAVHSKYMKGTNSELERQLHKLLVVYFKSETDPKNDGSYSGKNPRAFAELPYHMYMGGMWKELEELLTNVNYVVNKCRAGLAHRLIEDYTPSVVHVSAAKTREVTRFIQVPKIKEFRDFVSRNLHILTLNPSLTLQQAINEPSTSLISSEATKVLTSSSQPHPLVYWKNKPATYSPCQLTITGNVQPINCVAVSHDHELIACGSRDCTVKLYNIQTGRDSGTFIGHAGPIMGVCFVGANYLCSASQDGRLSLWDIRGGHRIEVMCGHSRAVQHCAANRSGKLIVSVSLDCSIKVWKGDNGKIQATMRTQGYNNKPLNCIAFHPEGQLVAVGGWDTHVKIWDTLNQKRLKVLRGHRTSVQSCAYARSGRYIASASLDGEVRLWATKSGATIGTIMGHAQSVTCLAFSEEGAVLVTGSNDQTLKMWSSTLGTPVKVNSSGEDGPVLCLAGNSKRQQVLAGHRSGVVRMLEIRTRKTVTEIPHGNIPITTVSWGPKNDGYCLTGAADGSLRVWELLRVDKRFAELQGHSSLVRCSVWSDTLLASGSEDMTINIWPSSAMYYSKMKKSADPFVVQPNMTLHGHTGPVNSLSISSNGLLLASASADMSVILWDTITFKKVHIFDACHKDWINACMFSDTNPDLLITSSNDFTLKLWDVKAKVEKATLTGHSSAVTQAVFQQGCIVSASSDGLVKVWTHKGVEITTMRCHKKRISGCILYLPQKGDSSSWADIMADEEEEEIAKRRQTFDLKGAIIVTGSDDGLVGFWRPFVAHKLSSLTGHANQIKTLALTKENHIVSASTDKTVKVWAPPVESGTLTEVTSTVSMYHSGPVVDISVSTDGEFVATVGRDGVLKIWGSSPSDEDATFVVLHEVVVCEQSEPLGAVCFINDDTVAVASYNCTLTTWMFSEQESLTKLRKLDIQEKSPITSLVLSKDKKCLIAGAVSGRITIILLSTQRELYLRDIHTDYVTAAIGFTGGKLVSIGLDNKLVFWQPDQGRGLKSINAFDESNNENKDRWPTTLTATSKLLVVGDSLGFVLVRKVSHHHEEKQSMSFRIESGKLLLEKKLHAKAITTLITSDHQELLLTGSEDCSIKLWKIIDSHHQLGLQQVGQFHCLSPVTTIAVTMATTSDKQLIVGGDILGHLYQLQWN